MSKTRESKETEQQTEQPGQPFANMMQTMKMMGDGSMMSQCCRPGCCGPAEERKDEEKPRPSARKTATKSRKK